MNRFELVRVLLLAVVEYDVSWLSPAQSVLYHRDPLANLIVVASSIDTSWMHSNPSTMNGVTCCLPRYKNDAVRS